MIFLKFIVSVDLHSAVSSPTPCMILLTNLDIIMKVSKSIKIVMTSRSASIVITLDMVMIQDAHLSIDANVVKESILRTPRIKLKQEVRIRVSFLNFFMLLTC